MLQVPKSMSSLLHGVDLGPLSILPAQVRPNASSMFGAGAKVLFGGTPLEGHSIPDCYGAIKPTAVFVPLEEILKDENFDLVTTEVFGPVQVSLSSTSD